MVKLWRSSYQEQAAKAGIRVNVVQAPSDGYWNAIWMNKTVSATRWNERPADQALHEIYLSSARWNESFYKDEAFDALLATARRELDFDKRKALYAKAQAHLLGNRWDAYSNPCDQDCWCELRGSKTSMRSSAKRSAGI